MTPGNLNITIWRGVTFELDLYVQVKTYNYDPVVNITPADFKRTHLENLEFYGFTYQYLDCSSEYINAELIISKSWSKPSQALVQPLLVLSKDADELIFNTTGVSILMDPDSTKSLEFDSGNYELLLTKSDNSIDSLIFGVVTVLGNKG